MITLDATDETLEMLTGAAVNTDYYVAWADQTTTAFTPGQTDGQATTATTTTITAAPASSTQRQIKFITIRNRSATTAQTVTIKHDKAGTERYLTCDVVLQPGEVLEYTSGAGFYVQGRRGRKSVEVDRDPGNTGRTVGFFKVGTAAEAVGQWYCHSKDTGNPGAWAVGTSGLAGRATDGTAAADAGCLVLGTPTGSHFLMGHSVTSNVAHGHWLFDVLWANNAIAVTTTTAQTINSVAFPARDLNGSANGQGVWVGILVTTATTNGAAVTNTTMSYTNQDGTAGKTATISSFPATAVAGTVVWFQLAAGDTGVRSIQTVTLGTSYGGGAISLIAAVPVSHAPVVAANIGANSLVGGTGFSQADTGTRLYTGACLLPFYQASATTATNTAGAIYVEDR